MAQYDIIPILKANRRKWLSKTELKPFFSITEQNLTKNVARLSKYHKCYGLQHKRNKRGKNFLRYI
jgi:hypothetical protein